MTSVFNKIRKDLHCKRFSYSTKDYSFKETLDELFGCNCDCLHKHLGTFIEFQRKSDQLTLAHKVFYSNFKEKIYPIYYKFQKESTREDNFIGNVVLNIVKVEDDNTKHITFRYLKGRNKVRFPPQIGAKGNPVFMLFFERDSRDMQRLTGGNALFFRSRIIYFKSY